MFSIHCKVLRVGRRKKEESILVQNRRERKTRGLRDSPEIPCCHLYAVPYSSV